MQERMERPEYLGARIEIGGRVTEGQLGDIQFRAGQASWEERERLIFEDPLAPWGEFMYLEPYLQEQEIPYDRWSSYYDGAPPILVRWRPGMEEPLTVPAAHDLTDTVLPWRTVCEWIEGWHSGAYTVVELVSRLKRSAGAHIEPLPPFAVGEPPVEEPAETEGETASVDPQANPFEDGAG